MNKPGKLTKARADELTKELETSLKFAKPPPRKPVSHGHSGSRTRSRVITNYLNHLASDIEGKCHGLWDTRPNETYDGLGQRR